MKIIDRTAPVTIYSFRKCLVNIILNTHFESKAVIWLINTHVSEQNSTYGK